MSVRLASIFAIVVAVSAFLVGIAPAANGSTAGLSIVSVSSDGTQANGHSYAINVSTSGRIVYFYSEGTNLVPSGASGTFRHDRSTGVTEHVFNHRAAGVTPDGRYFPFYSSAQFVPADTDSVQDVYLYDSQTGEIELVSQSTAGESGDTESRSVAISDDGRYVVFDSSSRNLVSPALPNSYRLPYIRDRQTGETKLMELTFQSAFGPGISGDGSTVLFRNRYRLAEYDVATGSVTLLMGMSGATYDMNRWMNEDGTLTVFTTTHAGLVPGESGFNDVFVYDRTRNAFHMASVSSEGVHGNLNSWGDSASAAAEFLVFTSDSTNLVPGDTNDRVDVFVHSRLSGETERVSVSDSGSQSTSYVTGGGKISSNGSTIIFNSNAGNLVPGDSNGSSDVFLLGNPFIDLIPQADLALVKTVDKAVAVLGDQIEYHFAITNDGPDNFVGGEFRDELPNWLTFDGVSSDGPPCIHDGSLTGGTVACDLDDGTAGFIANVSITVTLGQGAPHVTTNTASVASETLDPDLLNNESSSSFQTPNGRITVTTTDDELNSDGDCSLREAIIAANTDTAVDACPAGSGADTVVLQAGATYQLARYGAFEDAAAEGDLDIHDDLIIEGSGSTIAREQFEDSLNQDPLLELFQIFEGVSVAIRDASLFGTIHNRSSLTLSDCVISGLFLDKFETWFVIDSVGTLVIERCVIENNRISIYLGGSATVSSSGTMTVRSSTFRNNDAGSQDFGGGGIVVRSGTLHVEDSTFEGNQGVGWNGISLGQAASGILSRPLPGETTQITIEGSTFVENTAPVIVNNGTMMIRSSTISNNRESGREETEGGSIANYGTLTISDSEIIVNGLFGARRRAVGASLYNRGTVLIERSTLANNKIFGDGEPPSMQRDGLVSEADEGGGVTIRNSTISNDNVTVAGGTNSMDHVTVHDATIEGPITISNSIVTRFPLPGGDSACVGPVVSLGHNITNDNTCPFDAASDLKNMDPLLGPLTDNGGPTRTHLPLSWSPAIDAGNLTACLNQSGMPVIQDQRGIPRPQDGNVDGEARCDIGAVEVHSNDGLVANIVVDTTDDELNNDGDCALREAIHAANTDSSVDACPAGDGPDIIALQQDATYNLTILGSNEDENATGDLDVLDELVVLGNGATIDGGYRENGLTEIGLGDRVLHLVNESNLTITDPTLTLISATITGGFEGSTESGPSYGGGIRNQYAYMRLIDVTVSGNQAEPIGGWGGGIWSFGYLSILDSRITNNKAGTNGDGGGILSYRALWMNRSEVRGNEARDGGGIYHSIQAVIVDSIISGNTATRNGGGVYGAYDDSPLTAIRSTFEGNRAVSGDGGAIFLDNLEGSDLINVTLSNNVAGRRGGALYHSNSWEEESYVTNSTIANNIAEDIDQEGPVAGGGIWGNGIRSSGNIIANNVPSDCSVSIESLGYNIDRDGTCGLNATGDLSNTDPLLGPLADNGGPTMTHALLPGSLAVDAVPVSECLDSNDQPLTVDQRGFARPDGTACDIGAYELQSLLGKTIEVNTTDDELNSDGDCSLREAIIAANTDTAVDACPAGSGADTVTLQAGATYLLSVNGVKENIAQKGDLDLTDDLSIIGNGATVDGGARVQFLYEDRRVTYEAGFGDRVFEIHPNVTAHFSDITVTGGLRVGIENEGEDITGGGILNRGNLTLEQVRVRGNIINANKDNSLSRGGGIFNAGTLSVIDSSIILNAAIGDAGGSGGGDAYGGGIDNMVGAAALIQRSLIYANTAQAGSGNNVGGDARGGGIAHWPGGTVSILNSTVSENSATGGVGVRQSDGVGVGHGLWAGSGAEIRSTTITDRLFSYENDDDQGPSLFGSVVSTDFIFGRVQSRGYNLLFATIQPAIDVDGNGNTEVGNIVGQDPLLGPLAEHGGPTLTRSLPANSPAVDAIPNDQCLHGDGSPLAIDQRGQHRPHGSACDIGAFEGDVPLPGVLHVTVQEDVEDGRCDDHCTIREAVTTAPTGTTIHIPAGIYTLEHLAPLKIDRGLILIGEDRETTIIQVSTEPTTLSSKVFDAVDGHSTISSLTVRHSKTGIVNSAPSLVIENAMVTLNTNWGIINDDGSLTIRNSIFEENNGGANLGSIATIEDSVFRNNEREGLAGDGSSITVVRSEFNSNGAEGIVNRGTMLIEGSVIVGNADRGIYNSEVLTIDSSLISDNVGGGIRNRHHLNVLNSTITGNTALVGAGIYDDDEDNQLTLVNTTISGNTGTFGGGIWGQGDIVHSTIANNEGGGVQGSGSRYWASIVVNNSPADCVNPALFFESLGYNLDSDGTCSFDATGDLSNTDPLLGPLADNGGPTMTHALLSGSPAIDAVPASNCVDAGGQALTTDQRGIVRPQGPACDIGSFEVEQVSGNPVDLSIWGNHNVFSVDPGGSFSYGATARNLSGNEARDVHILVPVASGFSFRSSDAGCAESNGVVDCPLGTIAPAGFRHTSITMDVDANIDPGQGIYISTTIRVVTYSDHDTNPANDTDTVNVPLTADDVRIRDTTHTPSTGPGETASYTVQVTRSNTDISPPNTVVTFALDEDTRFASGSGGCTDAGGAANCPISYGGLRSELGSATITVRVDQSATVKVVIEATVTSDRYDPDSSNNSATFTTSIIPPSHTVDVGIEKTASVSSVAPEGLVAYTLVATNHSSKLATGVVITDPLPTGSILDSATEGCAQVGVTVICPVGALAGGESKTVSIIIVSPGTPGTIVNTAEVDSDQPDSNPFNDLSSVSVEVLQPAVQVDLGIVKTADVATAAPGGTVTYTLVVTNHSTATANNVVVSDTLPTGTSFHSASAGCSAASGTATCSMGALGASQSVTMTIAAVVDSSTTGAIVNTAQVSAGETDSNASNNIATASVDVNSEIIVSPVVLGAVRYGEEFQVEVRGDRVLGLAGAQFAVTFDPAVLEYVDATVDTEFSTCQVLPPTHTSGRVALAFVCAQGRSGTDMPLWTLTFRHIGESLTTTTQLAVADVDLASGAIPSMTIPGRGSDITITIYVGTCGDPSGDGQITIVDAVIMLQIVVGLYQPTSIQAVLANLDGTGGVEVTDVITALQYIVGVIPTPETCG